MNHEQNSDTSGGTPADANHTPGTPDGTNNGDPPNGGPMSESGNSTRTGDDQQT